MHHAQQVRLKNTTPKRSPNKSPLNPKNLKTCQQILHKRDLSLQQVRHLRMPLMDHKKLNRNQRMIYAYIYFLLYYCIHS